MVQIQNSVTDQFKKPLLSEIIPDAKQHLDTASTHLPPRGNTNNSACYVKKGMDRTSGETETMDA